MSTSEVPPVDRTQQTTIHGGDPNEVRRRQATETGMHSDYVVLTEEERRKGFVRPVRRTYVHEKCGTKTTMGLALAETYARCPDFYGSTFCVACGSHFPVGADGEFVWSGGGTKVGT